eukprot:gene228-3996_t
MLTGKNGPATRTVVDPAGGDIAGVPVRGVVAQACIGCGSATVAPSLGN